MEQQGARSIHRLSVTEVRQAKVDASDGGGLTLRISAKGGAAWTLGFTSPDGRRREMGLGVCSRQSAKLAGESLTHARELAAEARAKLARGIDPLAERQRARDAARDELAREKGEAATVREVEHWTLARCARDYHERVIEPKKTAKHAAQWIASLENHIPADMWRAPIVTITAPAIVRALLAMKPHDRARQFGRADRMGETRSRIAQRLVAAWDDAIFHGRATVNPASTARRKLTEEAPKRRRGSHRALPYAEAAAVMREVEQADGTAARALAFAIYTAARTAEVLGARWSEIDLAAKTWHIPAERMKARRAHDVPLSEQALRVLATVNGRDAELVFPSNVPTDDGRARELSNMAMLTALSRLGLRDRTTVHGLARSTFSTWANERAIARPDVIEAALAHTEKDKTRAAYNRASFADERRALLQAWGDYLTREAAQVVALRAA